MTEDSFLKIARSVIESQNPTSEEIDNSTIHNELGKLASLAWKHFPTTDSEDTYIQKMMDQFKAQHPKGHNSAQRLFLAELYEKTSHHQRR